MTSPARRPRARWPLHPFTVAVALLLLGGLGVASAFREVGPAILVLTAVSGAAAGFANSGST